MATQLKGESMADTTQVDWKAIDSRPDFQELHRRKMGFLWGLMVFSLVFYFLLPIGAAYFQNIYRIKVWGPVNVGLVFALPLLGHATWHLYRRGVAPAASTRN